MKHRNSYLLAGYWSRLRRGHDVPDQCDIDPRAIKRILSSVFIVDAEDPAHCYYRLAGTSLCERYGFELKGTGFLAHWEAASRASLTLLLRQSLALRQPVVLSSLAASSDGAVVEIETVLAPVAFASRTPSRFLGVMQVLSDPTPLAGRSIAFQRLVASQFLREDEPLWTDIPPASPSLPSLRTHPKAPHLRLVASREKPMPAKFEMDDAMLELMKHLEIVVEPAAVLVHG